MTPDTVAVRTILSGARIAIFAIDARGVIQFVDGRLVETIGFATDELVGSSVFDRFGREGDIGFALGHTLGGNDYRGIIRLESFSLECHLTPSRDSTNSI